jgi:hypothetical protein
VVSTRVLAVTGLLLALVLAGVVSHYASDRPDGLNRVAADKGLDARQQDTPADGSPLAGYDAKGVDDDRLGGAVAGVTGVVVVLVLTGGVTYLVRRRRSGAAQE